MSFTPHEIRVRLRILQDVIETTNPDEPKLAEVRRQIQSLEAQLAAMGELPEAPEGESSPAPNPAAPPPVVVGLKPLRLMGRAPKN